MSNPRVYTITMTTAAGGGGTSYSSGTVKGRVVSVQYVKPGAGGFDNGSTMTLTGEKTGIAIWGETGVNASAIRYPRAATCDTIGAASLYAAAGEPVETPIVLGGERLKMVVSAGGATKTATWYVTVE